MVSDLGLPKMDGIDSFKKMKEMNSDVQVIVVSGFFDPQIKLELERLGVKGFIQKPYKADQILLTIREILDKREM